MGEQNLSDLIDRLGEAALECRAVIREAHGATKDLKVVIGEARDVMAALRVAAQEQVGTDVDQLLETHVRAEMAKFTKAVNTNLSEVAQRTVEKFDVIRAPLLAALGEIGEAVNSHRASIGLTRSKLDFDRGHGISVRSAHPPAAGDGDG